MMLQLAGVIALILVIALGSLMVRTAVDGRRSTDYPFWSWGTFAPVLYGLLCYYLGRFG